jgi:hypothetical protein
MALMLTGSSGGRRLWFNQFCTDSTCTEARFLITQINN